MKRGRELEESGLSDSARPARTPLAPKAPAATRILPELTPRLDRLLTPESFASKPPENAPSLDVQDILAEFGAQSDLDSILKALSQARRKVLDLQGELSKTKEQVAVEVAQRKTEKALLETERKRAELRLAEAIQKQKELLTLQTELEARVEEERAQALKTEQTLREKLAAASSVVEKSTPPPPSSTSVSAAEKETRSLRLEVQVVTTERDMLKAQVEKQAARIDGLMRESEEALKLGRKTKEQQATIEQLAATGTDDRDELIAQLRAEISHLANADEKNKVLQQEVTMLRDRIQNTQALKEQVTSLGKKLDKAQKLAESAEQLRVTNENLIKERNAWNAAIASSPLASEFTSPAQLARIVSELRKENEILIEKNGQQSAEIKRLQLRAADTSGGEAKAEVQASQRQIKELSEALKQLERTHAALQRDRDSIRALLDSYTADEPTSYEQVLAQRVAALEKTVEEKTKLLSEFGRENANNRPAGNEQLRAEVDAAKGEVEQLKKENERLMEELGKAETKLTRGEFDPKTTKILHMAINPESRALASKEKLELETLRQENATLRGNLSSSSSRQKLPLSAPTSLTEEDLRRQVNALEVKYDRLSRAFKKQMKDVREASYQLFGYALDIDYAEGSQTYRVRCMYSDNDDDFLVFCSTREGIVLIESEWSKTLQSTIESYLIREHSIPAFLSAVLLELFSKKTQTQ